MATLQPKNKRDFADEIAYYNQYIIEPLKKKCPEVFDDAVSKQYQITIINYDKTTKIQVNKGDIVPEQDPEIREGFDFDGWFDSSTDEEWDFSKKVNEDTEIYAKWDAIKDSPDEGYSYTISIIFWRCFMGCIKEVDTCGIYSEISGKAARSFLQWAGGKGQILKEIKKYYPFDRGGVTKYAEPFIGGGAVLFDILNKYSLKDVYISDTNAELINAYLTIRDDVESLIAILLEMQNDFLVKSPDDKQAYYLSKRSLFNDMILNPDKSSLDAALMLFLNKTCFNGLYRVNREGLFNVSKGTDRNSLLCDENNLRKVSKKLQDVQIVCGDYKESSKFIDSDTFVYFDPPYRPLGDTSSFTSYTKNSFTDNDQIELAHFVKELDEKGAKFVLSNSDPQNTNSGDTFFDSLYSAYNIKRIEALRVINCNGAARGRVKELLISNLEPVCEKRLVL